MAKEILFRSEHPNAGAGLAATLQSVCVVVVDSVPFLYIKTGVAATAWSLSSVYDTTDPVGPQFLPEISLFTNDLAGGITEDWAPVDGGSTPAPIPVWPDVTRVYCGGDDITETELTGVESNGIPIGAVRVFELGDQSHGPILITPYSIAETYGSGGSLARNRIVTPGPAGSPLVIPQGGVFALEKIEDGSTMHGWRVLWAITNQAHHFGIQQLQVPRPLAVVLPAGDTNDLATTGTLKRTRLSVTTDAAGSRLTGFVHNSFTTLNTIGDGEFKIIENMGPGPLTLPHLVGTAANSMYMANGAPIVLGIGGTAVFLYDITLASGLWRCLGSSASQGLGVGPRMETAALPAGDTDDWAPAGIHTRQCVLVTPNAAGSTLTGISAGYEGEVLYLAVQYGGGTLTLAEYRTSAGVNRFIMPNLVDKVIQPGGGIAIVYRGAPQECWMALIG